MESGVLGSNLRLPRTACKCRVIVYSPLGGFTSSFAKLKKEIDKESGSSMVEGVLQSDLKVTSKFSL